jgi:hypothetical protein
MVIIKTRKNQVKEDNQQKYQLSLRIVLVWIQQNLCVVGKQRVRLVRDYVKRFVKIAKFIIFFPIKSMIESIFEKSIFL